MKKILLVTDVYGWGGHVRAEYIKKYLSDEFDFTIMDGDEFKEYTNKVFNKVDYKKYDLIYLLFHTMLLRKDVTRLLRIKEFKIITIVTAFPVLRAGFNRNINLFRTRANKCIAIGANNNISLNQLKELYGGETFYAPRGVDDNIFYPTKKFEEKKPDDLTVVFVGKEGSPEKGHHIIKKACEIANVKFISNQRIYTNALTPDQMRDFYNKGDVYCVASTMDGTPNTALEASACGLVLVANRIGNMPDLIDNHKNGWLLDRKVDRYVHRLNWIKNNQRKSWELGQKGREDLLRDWTWEKVLNKNEREIFRKLI